MGVPEELNNSKLHQVVPIGRHKRSPVPATALSAHPTKRAENGMVETRQAQAGMELALRGRQRGAAHQ